VTAGSGMTAQTDMGHNTGDLDGDGFPDIFIGTGNPDFEDFDLLYLMTPDGSGGFQSADVSVSSGITVLGKTRCHGMAFGDINDDGMVDVFTNNGGPSTLPLTIQENSLFEAVPNGNNWVGFELEGVLSNRSAVGAHLIAITDSGAEVHRYKRIGHGFGNTNSPVQHVAIGTDSTVNSLEIRWPSGIVQRLVQPTMSQVHAIVETGLRAPGSAPLGAAFPVEIVGPPGHTALLYYSTTTISVPLPTLGGILELGPPLANIGTTTLAGDGKGAFLVPIPSIPALSGLTVHLQALLYAPATFTELALSNRLSPNLQ
jgi:hypothetical protein